MKKFLIPCLAALTVMTVSAQAEEAQYLRTLPQYKYVRTTLLSQESYPEVRIFPGYPYTLFSSYSDTEPVFLCFPGPEGALAESFGSQEASYLDEENAIQYQYYVESSNSYEEFINEAEDDSYILLDGSDGAAARIDPDRCTAYGMIGTKEFGKSSKLEFRVVMDNLDSKMPLDTRVQTLSDTILNEVNRIREQMHYETMDPYWSAGKFAGMKILDYDFQHLLVLDFPTFKVQFDGGEVEEAPIITEVDGTTVDGLVDFGEGVYCELELEFEDYSYPMSKKEEDPASVSELTTEGGRNWTVYVANTDSENHPYSWYGSTPAGFQNEYGDEVYVSIHFDGENLYWADEADMLNDLSKFDGFKVISPEEDPYVPQEPTAEAPAEETPAAEQPAEAGTWVCDSCGTENSGNFCANCGAAKPAPAEWTCSSCGQVNTGNFCANCGTARP